jgi:hypothetical protein
MNIHNDFKFLTQPDEIAKCKCGVAATEFFYSVDFMEEVKLCNGCYNSEPIKRKYKWDILEHRLSPDMNTPAASNMFAYRRAATESSVPAAEAASQNTFKYLSSNVDEMDVDALVDNCIDMHMFFYRREFARGFKKVFKEKLQMHQNMARLSQMLQKPLDTSMVAAASAAAKALLAQHEPPSFASNAMYATPFVPAPAAVAAAAAEIPLPPSPQKQGQEQKKQVTFSLGPEPARVTEVTPLSGSHSKKWLKKRVEYLTKKGMVLRR